MEIVEINLQCHNGTSCLHMMVTTWLTAALMTAMVAHRLLKYLFPLFSYFICTWLSPLFWLRHTKQSTGNTSEINPQCDDRANCLCDGDEKKNNSSSLPSDYATMFCSRPVYLQRHQHIGNHDHQSIFSKAFESSW